MFNPRLTETLTDFPFARLNALIAPIAPPAHLSMINMSVGEPQGAMPAFARQIVNDEIDGWNRYPPNQGIPDLNVAIVEWLNRRYRLTVSLRYVEGMSIAEIAAVLGCSEGMVKNMLFRSLRRLRQELTEARRVP